MQVGGSRIQQPCHRGGAREKFLFQGAAQQLRAFVAVNDEADDVRKHQGQQQERHHLAGQAACPEFAHELLTWAVKQ